MRIQTCMYFCNMIAHVRKQLPQLCNEHSAQGHLATSLWKHHNSYIFSNVRSLLILKAIFYLVKLLLTFCFYMTLKLASDRYNSICTEQCIKPMCWSERHSQKRRLLSCFTFDCLCMTVHLSFSKPVARDSKPGKQHILFTK